MIFLFVQSIICKHVYDRSYDYGTFSLIIDPLDIVEIVLKAPLKTNIEDWLDDDLYLEVDEFDQSGNVKTNGPFTCKDDLYGIVYESRNYTLRFVNEGPNESQIQLDFYRISIGSRYTSHFIYSIDDSNKNCKVLVGVLGGIFGLIVLMLASSGITETKCCKKC